MTRFIRLIITHGIFGLLIPSGYSAHSSNEPEIGLISKSTSAAEIEALLKSPLTVYEVEEKFGQPMTVSNGNWGNIMYRLPDNRWLTFWFKGPHVTGARYDSQEIKGVQPKTYKLTVDYEASSRSYYYSVDGKIFRTYDELTGFLTTLPKAAIIEHQTSCVIFTDQKPLLTSKEELDALKAFCKKTSLVLIHYPAG